MKNTKIIQLVLLSLVLIAVPIHLTMAVQQPSFPISFSLNPSVFPVNSNVSTLACISVVGPANAISIHLIIMM